MAWCLTGTYAGKALCHEFQTHPLADAAKAHHAVMEASTLGKIVLIP